MALGYNTGLTSSSAGANNGLSIMVKNSKQLKDEDAKKKLLAEAAEASAKSYNASSELYSRIKDSWYTNRRHKQTMLQRMLKDLRARKGEYSDGELQAIRDGGGADPVFIKITGTKARAASAWIRDMLMPASGEYPFSVRPTPIPTLEDSVAQNVQKQAIAKAGQMLMQGMPPTPEELQQLQETAKQHALVMVNHIAEAAAERMSTKIEDEMEEGDWSRALEEFIEDFVTYPTAFIKGPYQRTRKTLVWKMGKPEVDTQVKMAWRRVSPFDIYPAPYTDTLQKGDVIERIRFTKEQIWGLIGLEGYQETEIRAVLREYDDKQLVNWIWEDWERERLESSSSYFMTDADTIDALHYWGSVQGKMLKDWGVKEIPDDEGYYEVDAVLIGNHVIRAVVNDHPLGERPYHHACWDSVPGAVWGISLPEQMEEHQKICNATVRALMTNMSVASGPQVEVNIDRMAQGEDISSVYPMKIWQTKSTIVSGDNKPAIQFFQPIINSTELMGVFNQFEQKADDATNVPRYAYGNEKVGGAGATATGLQTLMSSAAKGIRRAIANIDLNVIKPTVKQTFTWLMLNNPDPGIQGDIDVVASGSTAILIKEQAQTKAQSFLREAGPMIGPNVINALVKHIAHLQDLDIDDEIEADNLMRQQMAMQAQQQAASPEPPGAAAQAGSREAQHQAQAGR